MKTLFSFLFAIILLIIPAFGQTGGLMPNVYPVFTNVNGTTPVANGFVCTTTSGSATVLAPTYREYTNTTANQNPIRLNSSGRAVNGSTLVPIFLGAVEYRIALYAAGTGNTCNTVAMGTKIWEMDHVYNLEQLLTAGLAAFTKIVINDPAALGDTLIINASVDGYYTGMQLRSVNIDVGTRNWLIVDGQSAHGALDFTSSNARLGNPFTAGLPVLSLITTGGGAPTIAQSVFRTGNQFGPSITTYTARNVGIDWQEGGIQFTGDGLYRAQVVPIYTNGGQTGGDQKANCLSAARAVVACTYPVFDRGGLIIQRYSFLSWGSTGYGVDCPDTFIFRESQGVVAFRNTTDPNTPGDCTGYGATSGNHTIHVYGRRNNATNYNRLVMAGNMDAPSYIRTETAGVTARELQLGVSGVNYWQLDISNLGALVTVSDGSGDLGRSATAGRPNNAYIKTSISVGDIPATAGIVRIPNNTAFNARDFGNAADIPLVFLSNADVVTVGNTTNTTAIRGAITMANITSAGAQDYLCFNSGTTFVVQGTATCTVSSERYKHDFEPLDAGLETVLKIPTYSFIRNEHPELGRMVGLKAEDIAAIEPRLVIYDGEGRPDKVLYENYTAILTKAIQDLSRKVDKIEARIP